MSERAWHFYLDDMSSFATDALRYTQGLSLAEFEQNSMAYDATLRKIELIGEAAGNIPVNIRALAPLIPWREIIATRNRVATHISILITTPSGASFRMNYQRSSQKSPPCSNVSRQPTKPPTPHEKTRPRLQ